MLSGLTRLALKIKYWLSIRIHTACHCCCIWCKYYDECSKEENDIREMLEEWIAEEVK